MANFDQSLARRLQDALRAHLAVPNDTITFYRASRGGKLHHITPCAKKEMPDMVSIPTYGPGNIVEYEAKDFCNGCAKKGSRSWDKWLDLVETMSRIQADLDDPNSETPVSGRNRQLAKICAQTVPGTHPELQGVARTLCTALQVTIDAELASHDPRENLIAAAIDSMNTERESGQIPDTGRCGDHVTVLPRSKGNIYSHSSAHPVVVALWESYAAQGQNTGNLDDAAELALAQAATGIAGSDVPHECMPAKARFNGADYTHPHDWAKAEWSAAALEECESLCKLWSARIESWIAEPDITVCIGGYDPSFQCRFARAVSETVVGRPYAVDGEKTMFASIPEVLFDYLVTRADTFSRGNRWSGFSVVKIGDCASTTEELTVALGLYPNTFDDPGRALQAAHAVVS